MLKELFRNVQVVGISPHYKFMGNSSFGDTLVMALVSEPRDREVVCNSVSLKEALYMKHNEELFIPPIPPDSMSVHDIKDSRYCDQDTAVTSYTQLFNEFCENGRPKRSRRPTRMLTSSQLGSLE